MVACCFGLLGFPGIAVFGTRDHNVGNYSGPYSTITSQGTEHRNSPKPRHSESHDHLLKSLYLESQEPKMKGHYSSD